MEKGLTTLSGVTRRNFLKTTGVVAGVAAVGGVASVGVADIAQADAAGAVSTEEKFHCVCRPNCVGYCRLDVTVRDGNIVKTARHDFEDLPQFNRVCLRGLSNIHNIYDPERIKTPMKRVGERGEGKWEQISWDEALDTVADQFKKATDAYGSQAVAFWTSSGNFATLHGQAPGLLSRLVNVMNATPIDPSMDFALMKGVNQVCGNAGYWVSNEASTYVDSKTLIVWGANITEAQVQEWHFVREAQEAGVKMIVIDPSFTQIAAKADRWIPLRPGSDLALISAIMHVILEEGLQDDEFLKKHTVAPFLVRSDTGKFAHLSDTGVPAKQGPMDIMAMAPLMIDPSYVYDAATGALALADAAQDPALSGTHDFQGVSCKTALDLLKETVAKFTPEEAEKYTEIPADTIRELAHICADTPVMHRTGFSQSAWVNGVITTHAGITLCAITGNIGKPGAGFGLSCQLDPGINALYNYGFGKMPTTPKVSHLELREVMRTGKLFGKDFPVKAALISGANPVCTSVNINEIKTDILDKLDFIVTADYLFTDTVNYSDLVLPVAHWFEQEDINPYGQSLYIQHSEKAIDPLYESKTDGDIIRLLADKLGYGECFPDSDEEYLTNMLKSDHHKLMGIDYETLKEKKAMRYMPYPFIAWDKNMFFTPSGRMEFYVENPTPVLRMGQKLDESLYHLPKWMPPAEAWPENPLYEKYPFVLMSERSRYRVHSQWSNNTWIGELSPEPTVKMNPADARDRSLKDGAYVECFNDRGHVVVKLVYSEGIRRGTLIYPKNWQAPQHKAGSWNELTSSVYDPQNVNQSFMDNLCDIRVWEGDK
ncbi:MAG: molybdopterin-dependent oxidoreductase [Raoultibacter sp.]